MAKCILFLTAIIALATRPAFAKDEVEIAFDKCPKAVQTALRNQAGLVKGTIGKVEKEKEHHVVVFDAKIEKPDGTKLTVKVAADGRVLEKKEKKAK